MKGRSKCFKTEVNYKGDLKSSYNEVTSAVDDFFFYQQDQNTKTPIEEVCGLDKDIMLKNTPHIPWEYLGKPVNFSADPFL